jgi:protein-disulfide isomerase
MRNILAGLAMTGLLACNQGSTQPAPQQGATGNQPTEQDEGRLPDDQVVATWDGGELTYGELREKAAADLNKARVEYLKKAHQIEEQTLEGFVTQKIVEAKAEEKGLDEQAYIQTMVPEVEVSDQEIQAFYEKNKARIPGGLEGSEDRIRSFLEGQQKRAGVKKALDKIQEEANLTLDLPGPDLPKASFELAGRPSKGADDATVTIVEFSDFQCPFCARATEPVEQILQKYPEDVKVYFLHFPLTTIHPNAKPAAIASECAHRQGQFWPMHDKMFENQQALTRENFEEWASEIGLDVAAFQACLDDEAVAERVDADMAMGEKAGVGGTPSFFINGVQHQGIPSPAVIEGYVGS